LRIYLLEQKAGGVLSLDIDSADRKRIEAACARIAEGIATEAFFCVEDGATLKRVDSVLKGRLQLTKGMFELFELFGLIGTEAERDDVLINILASRKEHVRSPRD